MKKKEGKIKVLFCSCQQFHFIIKIDKLFPTWSVCWEGGGGGGAAIRELLSPGSANWPQNMGTIMPRR